MFTFKYNMLVYEGVDCSGKTTLKEYYEKSHNYRCLSIDRWYGTAIAYNRFFQRDNDDLVDSFYIDIESLSKCLNLFFIYVRTDIDVVWSRIQNRGDDMITEKAYIEGLNLEYENFFTNIDNIANVIVVDGSDSPSVNVEKIDYVIQNKFK